MPGLPQNPKIYHITHLRNLPQIVAADGIWSDAKRLELKIDCEIVGMSKIKQRRLENLDVDCHPGTKVGQYVPFYFCPRSIMLYILHQGNHPDVTYREGQRPIVHLQSDLLATVRWAGQNGVRWAFSDRNAGGRLAEFFKDTKNLERINWTAVAATDFRPMEIREGKQAEFLTFGFFPWMLIEKIGVIDLQIAKAVRECFDASGRQPQVSVEPTWYY